MRISDWSSDVCSSDLRLRQVDHPRRIYDRPVDRFVAQLMCDINLFEAEIVAESDGLVQARCGALDQRFAGDGAPRDGRGYQMRGPRLAPYEKIGRATGRQRVVQTGEIWGAAERRKQNRK